MEPEKLNETHTPPRILDRGVGTTAYWALAPDGHLILFVHGFNGEATSTWVDFPGRLMIEPRCLGSDLVFYGYDGLYTEAAESAVRLHDFIAELVTRPFRLLSRSLDPYPRRPASFAFNRITVVAHSLGAIVLRQALVEYYLSKKTWAHEIALVLYAPAHKGAKPRELAAAALANGGFWGSLLSFGLQSKFQVLRDLSSDSALITRLEEESKEALRGGSADYMRAKKVLWAPKDPIVVNQRFLQDPKAVIMDYTTHMSICKPTLRFSRPATELLEVL